MSATDEKIVKEPMIDTMKRLWPLIRDAKWNFALGFVMILMSTVVETLTPLAIGKTVDVVITDKNFTNLSFYCGAFLVLVILKSVLEALQAYVIQATGQSVTHDLRVTLFTKIQTLPVAYFDRNPTGRLLTRVLNDIKSLSELFTASISVLALDAMIILGTIVGMFWVHPKLAGTVLLSFPIVLVAVHFFGKRLAAAYRVSRQKLSEMNAFLGENIGAIATIQRLGAEKERMNKFRSIVEAHEVAQMDSLKVFAWVQPITNLINGVAAATLIAAGGYWVVKGEISVGILVAFLGYIRNLFQPVRDMVEKYNTFLSATVSAERVVSVLDEESEQFSGEEIKLPLEQRPMPVSFSNVTFRYPLRNANALDNVTFEIPEGKSLAVVGATGSGKSTLIRLMLRFYEPDSGSIIFGGRKLVDWDKHDLRSHIGVVHQDIYLFQGTIRDNLTLGRTNIADVYLKEQCDRAQLWSFISARGGLDMPVLEGGTNLSLGERQLVSFARILVFNPPVLVLDEATSSIDRMLERRLMEALNEVLQNRTSIVIAHRLSTIRHCDKVIVMEHGKLIEEGTYEALLQHRGIFAKFHEIHSQG